MSLEIKQVTSTTYHVGEDRFDTEAEARAFLTVEQNREWIESYVERTTKTDNPTRIAKQLDKILDLLIDYETNKHESKTELSVVASAAENAATVADAS